MELSLIVVFLVALVIFNIYRILKRGSVLSQGKVSKTDNPIVFWGTVIFLIAVALILIIIFGYTTLM
jgi:uncharacterized protein with PQ loop repeat